MGLGSSKVPAWAPPSLRKKDIPAQYLELRHPNGSVAHVLGVAPFSLSSVTEARALVRVAKPDSVLLELCDERVVPVWELLEQGRARPDGTISRPLPPLSVRAAREDARLRRPRWWLVDLPLEGSAALVGTTLGAEQAAAAAEAARLRAQTHLIDRRQSVTTQRSVVAALQALPRLAARPQLDEAKGQKTLAQQGAAAVAKVDALSDSELRRLRDRARDAASVDDPAIWARWRAAVEPVVQAERDEILAHRCWECLANLGPGGVAVAVVGASHLAGIERRWANTEPDRVKALLEPRDAPAVLGAVGPPLLVAAAATTAASYLPTLPRRLSFGALGLAPILASAYVAADALSRYEKTRQLQRRVDHL